ncbi:MAG: hypothetical protein MAG794_01001 [Gammaproteobacteria bacterium]|nr:hypothetical protein [Gammaproteobacteria bacterium]
MINAQRGWTLWSLLGTGALVVVGALLFMKLTPVYLDNYKLQEAMHSVAEDPRAADWGRRQIIREMTNVLYIDYGSEIVDLKSALSVEKTAAQTFIKVEYEVLVPLAYNVSALMDFNNKVEIIR